MGEENLVTGTARVDADVVLSAGGVGEEGLNDEGVESSGGLLDLLGEIGTKRRTRSALLLARLCDSLAPLRSLVIQVAIVSREVALSFTRDRRRPADASAEHRETGDETLGNENERTLTGLPARSLIHSATTL